MPNGEDEIRAVNMGLTLIPRVMQLRVLLSLMDDGNPLADMRPEYRAVREELRAAEKAAVGVVKATLALTEDD